MGNPLLVFSEKPEQKPIAVNLMRLMPHRVSSPQKMMSNHVHKL
jgi:hypothetical protein